MIKMNRMITSGTVLLVLVVGYIGFEGFNRWKESKHLHALQAKLEAAAKPVSVPVSSSVGSSDDGVRQLVASFLDRVKLD